MSTHSIFSVDLQVHPNALVLLSNSAGRVRLSSRIPFRRRGPRALPRERREHEEKRIQAVPQARQVGARGDREGPGQAQVVQADRPGAAPVAVDGRRRGGAQPHGVPRSEQGRPRRGGPRRRLPEAAVVAALLQRVQVPQVPLLEKVEVRVLGRQGAGARRRRAARIQDGRRPGRGGIRARHGADQVRRRAGAVARADSAGQGGRDRGVGVDHIQVDRARLRGDEQPRAAAQVRLQAALARRAVKADVARRGPLVRRVHGVAGGRARRRLRDGHGARPEVRPPVPAHIVPEGVQVPDRAAHARQDGGVDGIGARHAGEGGAESVPKAVLPAPDRQRRRVRRLRGNRALRARPVRQAVLGLLLRRAPVPAEGRLRAQPRRAAQDTAQGARNKLRRARRQGLRRADVAPELRAQAVFGRHVRHRHAAGGARRRRPRASRRAGGREGALRRARHVRRGHRGRTPRARRGAAGTVAAGSETE
mgnify:CR=1 FL=1